MGRKFDFINVQVQRGRLGTRLAVYFALCFLLAGLAAIGVVNMVMRQQALNEARDKARIILDHNLAIHTYFTHQLKPHVFPLAEQSKTVEYFDPVWMSSTYAVREIYTYFQDLSPRDYQYKECAVNARSPKNEADALEADFLRRLNQNPDLVQDTVIRDIDGRPFFVLLRTGESMQKSCLHCHSEPEQAPQDLVEEYGPARSFDREEGEVVSAISIRIPLQGAFAQVTRITWMLSAALVAILLILYILLTILNHRLLFAPLRGMAAKARQIAEKKEYLGDEVDMPQGSEMREIAMAFNNMSKRLKEHMHGLEDQVQSRTETLSEVNAMLHQEMDERKKAAQELQKYATQLEHLARTDELTQAANRRFFMQELQKEAGRSRRYRRPLSLIILDLDHFKDVNDTYGHAAGDSVLQAISNACRSTLRTQDLLARLGGEEFAILLPETGLEEAVQVAERIREVVQDLVVRTDEGQSIRCTASLGVASLQDEDRKDQDDGVEAVLHQADRALYAAKDAGRNRVAESGKR
ncbi:MAG: diguanylate cyclase [Desulfovermiculus sp.]